MRTTVIAVAVALAVAATARAAGPVTTGPAADELKKVDATLNQAAMKRDMDTFNRHLADEYRLTEPDGAVTDRKANVEAVRSGALKLESMKDSDVKAAVYGDTGVLTGHTEMKGTYQGQDISGPYRWTRVYVRRDGRWQCVAEQLTRVMK
jgi:ketosteroid isomerase-like protein